MKKYSLTVVTLLPFAYLLFAVFTGGCERSALPKFSPSEAHKKLLQILKEENDLTVITKEFDHALWIYLPIEENFLEIKANQEPSAAPSSEAVMASTIHFLDAEFKDRHFAVRYDIGPSKSYAKNPGFAPTFSEKYQTDQRNILTAISRAYSDFEETPGEERLVGRVPGDIDFAGEEKNTQHKEMVHSYVKTDKAPVIFVIVMADIVNGLESRVFLHLKDLTRAYTDQTFHGEYAKRAISDQPFGNPAIIGDKTGQHIDFKDISLPEFLAKQVVFRVNFKYTRSAFPPIGTPKEEILKAVVQTVDAYGFEEFVSVELRDLSDGTSTSVPKEELAGYREEPSKGRLIHIRFQ